MNFRELLLREMDTPERTAQLAQNLGLPQEELKQYAKGNKSIPVPTACHICEAIGVQIAQDIDVDVETDWLLHRHDLWNVVKEDLWQRWLRTDGERMWKSYWSRFKSHFRPVLWGEIVDEESWCDTEVDYVRSEWESRKKIEWEPLAFAFWEHLELMRVRTLGFVRLLNAPDVTSGVGGSRPQARTADDLPTHSGERQEIGDASPKDKAHD